MRWRTASQYALMWGIRLTPLPWALKRAAIDLATPKSIVVGTAIIPNEFGEILMLRARYSGRWVPPGGAIHPGENPRDGLLRECREELGAEARIVRLVGVYTVARTRNLFVAFLCEPPAAPPRLSAEHETHRHLPPASLPWWVREIARDALDPDMAPVFRTLGRQ